MARLGGMNGMRVVYGGLMPDTRVSSDVHVQMSVVGDGGVAVVMRREDTLRHGFV